MPGLLLGHLKNVCSSASKFTGSVQFSGDISNHLGLCDCGFSYITKDCVSVAEWQGHKEGMRDVKIRMDASKKALLIFVGQDIRRPKRTIDCKLYDKIYVKEAFEAKENLLLLRFPKDYDLVGGRVI